MEYRTASDPREERSQSYVNLTPKSLRSLGKIKRRLKGDKEKLDAGKRANGDYKSNEESEG